jgi:phosphatidylserine/phosphatidylglycerophosphate/cardiolipin synthase-like enzyme
MAAGNFPQLKALASTRRLASTYSSLGRPPPGTKGAPACDLSPTNEPAFSVVEKSVHQAWIDVIERSEHFIYIENQYFISKYDDKEADDLCVLPGLILWLIGRA